MLESVFATFSHTALEWPFATHVACSVVCVSVLDTRAESSRMLFCGADSCGPKGPCVTWEWKWATLRGQNMPAHCIVLGSM